MADEQVRSTTRRDFLGWVSGGLVFLGVLFSGVPLIGALVIRPAGGKKGKFVPIGRTATLNVGEPTSLTFDDAQQDAYLHQTVSRSVWAVKRASGEIVVFSPICPHLGCSAAWETKNKRFLCPCHTSVWTVDGKLVSGPSPRDLDILPSKVVDGVLMVEWQQFKVAIPEKILIG